MSNLVSSPEPIEVSVVIPAGQTEPAEGVQVYGRLVGIGFGSAFGSASGITFKSANTKGGTYRPVREITDTDISLRTLVAADVTNSADANVALDLGDWLSVNWIKPVLLVAQVSDTTIRLLIAG